MPRLLLITLVLSISSTVDAQIIQDAELVEAPISTEVEVTVSAETPPTENIEAVEETVTEKTSDETSSEDAEELAEISEPYFEDEEWEVHGYYDDNYEEDTTAYTLPPEIVLPELPGEEISYKLKLHKYTHHDLHGRADSDIGKLKFKSKLMPNNTVKMDIKLRGEEELLFKAYLDLANYTMELDGGGSILTEEHKTMMEYTAEHLRQRLIKKFQDEIPDHSFMTVQMLTYWSKSPSGFKHVKRDVVSN